MTKILFTKTPEIPSIEPETKQKKMDVYSLKMHSKIHVRIFGKKKAHAVILSLTFDAHTHTHAHTHEENKIRPEKQKYFPPDFSATDGDATDVENRIQLAYARENTWNNSFSDIFHCKCYTWIRRTTGSS